MTKPFQLSYIFLHLFPTHLSLIPHHYALQSGVTCCIVPVDMLPVCSVHAVGMSPPSVYVVGHISAPFALWSGTLFL